MPARRGPVVFHQTHIPVYLGSWVARSEGNVKTTVELPDELLRRAKVAAASRGRPLKDLVEEGLRLVLDTPPGGRRRASLAELMLNARGVVDLGAPDLASNPAHLAGFGVDEPGDR